MTFCKLGNSAEAESDIVKVFTEEEETMSYGPPLMKGIAEGMAKTICRTLTKEAVEKLTEQVKIPDNCKEIGVPRVNPEIWNSLPAPARVNDLNLQKTQQTISYGLITLANVANILAQSTGASPVILGAMNCLKNGSNLLGMGFQEISSKRRSAMKPHMAQEYSGICAMKTVRSEFLFGDSLDEELKKSKATSELTRKVTNKTRPHYKKPYERLNQSNFNSLNLNRPSQQYQNQNRGGGQKRGQHHNYRRWKGPQRQ